ncbi:YihY/virulence factor BrkB family protein [Rhizobium sp. 2MFCol3.1]|uniref:YihY/virulence factor BrkB family protein n=1 Tax=Rhizobium sp. 2MFCol3.1 TaxID=1246459 RepID=UPI0003607131|nr:YihY/virulence factor BrkB family protein [Rhizobium sp. 2MFCol3.1]
MSRRGVVTTAALLTAVGISLVINQKAKPITKVVADGDDPHGRNAEVPEAIPITGLKDVLWRVFHQISEDRVTLIAAGVTFYLLLGLFPAISAIVSLYGLVADPSTMADHLRQLAGVLPPGAFDLIAERIGTLTASRNSTLGVTFVFGLAVALWSTHSATLAIFDAMNVAYDEEEKRGLIRLNLIGLAFTICAMASATLVVGLVAVIPVLLSYVWLDQFEEQMALILRWPVLFLIVAAATTAIYRFGPSRQPARLRWISWGSVLVTLCWFAMSLGFSFYLTHFANYDATYGTLGALIGFLVWTWLSILILIVGGELNAELEHQTAKDTTTGPPLPMGSRGAYVADTLGHTVGGKIV